MDAICRESLRLYPPATMVFREAYRDMVLPLSEPIAYDGTAMSKVPIPAGTMLVLGLGSTNRCKDIWDDALEFKPEWWLSPLPPTVVESRIPGVYSHTMTLNGGARSCIGFKISQLEMKVVLTVILSTFKVSFAEETKDVVWKLAAVRYPTRGQVSNQPEFLLALERLKV
ncbi:hypothetical protein QCA50_019332 [Cerrena zonata]|uniref:Cytochrome P450 n=1 Tax=Cerrena zonata TaxID=2478898 RepID=A0AAW0FJY4_9APHY